MHHNQTFLPRFCYLLFVIVIVIVIAICLIIWTTVKGSQYASQSNFPPQVLPAAIQQFLLLQPPLQYENPISVASHFWSVLGNNHNFTLMSRGLNIKELHAHCKLYVHICFVCRLINQFKLAAYPLQVQPPRKVQMHL